MACMTDEAGDRDAAGAVSVVLVVESGDSPSDLVVALRDGTPEGWGCRPRHGLPPMLDRGPSRLVVDLSGVRRLSSGGVGALLQILDRSRRHGVDVVLRRPTRRSLVTLGRSGLLAALPVEGRRPASAAPRQVG